MTNPTDAQLVRVTLSTGETHLASFHESHRMLGDGPGYSVLLLPIGYWFCGVDRVRCGELWKVRRREDALSRL